MAKRVRTIHTDDTNGQPATQQVGFGIDGVQYEIDLTDPNANNLREALQPYTEAGRRTGGRRQVTRLESTPATAASTPAPPTDARTIRAWAAANGYQCSHRGRISEDVVQAYNAAHS